MSFARLPGRIIRWSAAGLALAGGAYAAYAGVAWSRYGHGPAPAAPRDRDELLDRFMPRYDVAQRHQIRVAASPAETVGAAWRTDLLESPVVRGIIRAREVILGAGPAARRAPQGFLAEMQALGWGILTEVPGREVVVGAVTQPWKAAVVFRALPPEEFAAFAEPGYVKIAWTLRVDPIGATHSVFRTETRVAATDSSARATFRLYWSAFSPGMALIRLVLLRQVKRDAERSERNADAAPLRRQAE
jgi:hypothetical protein